MSVIQFFRILWARRAILLTATLGCFLAACVAAELIPPRYVATSRVMMNIMKPDPVTGQVIASQFQKTYVKTQIELIKDYRVAGKVVDTLGWASSPQLATQYAARSEKNSKDFRRWLAQIIIDNTGANLIDSSNILEISYSSRDPEIAAKVADIVRQAYIDQTLAFRRSDATRSAEWFQNQTEKLRKQLTDAEKRKTDFERANGIIIQNDDTTDADTARLQALAQQAPMAPAVSIGGGMVGMTPAQTQLAQMDLSIATAIQTLGPNHPDLVSLKAQRVILAATAAKEAAVARANASGGGPSGPSLQSLYTSQQAKVLSQRGVVTQAQQLATEVTILRDQFKKSAGRAADLVQQADADDSGLSSLGSAVAPQSSKFPNLPLIFFGSLAFGIVLGILTSLAAELLSRKVRGSEDLAIEGVPVIGTMGREVDTHEKKTWWQWLGYRPLFTKRVKA
ncbi:MAG: Wzz/FepE/Etk N-terminal domain-containing protein [Sphingobium sp.]